MIIDTIKNAKPDTISVVVLDNKTEHFNQMESRMEANNIEITKLSKKNEILNKNIVFVILNNSAQIKKLNEVISNLYKYYKFKNYHIYIDESDTFNKTDNSNSSEDSDPKCHLAWNKHFEIIKKFNLENTKRICISATFENNCYYQNVLTKNTFVIPEKINYIKINNQKDWKNGDLNPVKKEINRIKKDGTNEAILYCSNYLNSKQEEIAGELYDKFNIPVILYNGKGIEIFINDKQKIYPGNISNAMTWVEKRYFGPVIIVGHRLMDRGISFCSTSKNKPLTATVMFYSGSNVVTAVNIAQILGRITGTSRPDITTRTVYTDEKVYNTYTNYLKNQNMIFKEIQKVENKDLLLKDVMNKLQLNKLDRKLDRSTLKTVNREYKEASSSVKHTKESDPEKMHRLVNSWISITNNTAIALVFRQMIENQGKLQNSLIRDYFETIGPYNAMTNTNTSARYNLVFRKDSEYHYIKNEVLEYIQKNKN